MSDLTPVEFAATLGYGDDRTEPAATLRELLDPILDAFSESRDHHECPAVCELCGDHLAATKCPSCYGSGCGPGTGTGAYEECGHCGGVGKIHEGCMEMSYADLAAEVSRLRGTHFTVECGGCTSAVCVLDGCQLAPKEQQ